MQGAVRLCRRMQGLGVGHPRRSTGLWRLLPEDGRSLPEKHGQLH